MADSSLITLTEVATHIDARALALREKGWGNWCSTSDLGRSDDAGICWRKDTWREKDHWLTKLHGRWRAQHTYVGGLFATSVLLQHTTSGHTLLVSVSHMPAQVDGLGNQRWQRFDEFWRARKEAYTHAMSAWSTYVKNLVRRKKPDAAMVVADWNINLKDDWFREYMHDHWGTRLGMKCAWKHFPTGGGSLGGGRIIDGTYYSGMTTEGAVLMPKGPSSDHRPYRERFALQGGAAHAGPVKFYDPASGHIRRGIEWWGFGDYAYDEFFEKTKVLEDGSTVVTFDFKALEAVLGAEE